MTNFASNIHISNFKSIRSLDLKDCKRLNLIIGRPNVGKSNILEALSLFSVLYWINNNLNGFLRAEQKSDLFHDGNSEKEIEVVIDNDAVKATPNNINILWEGHLYEYEIDDKFNFKNKDESVKINPSYPYKNYFFPAKIEFLNKESYPYLAPPSGDNIYDVIQSNKDLKQEFFGIFDEYGLNLVFDKSSHELKIMKGVEKGEIDLIPFSSVADSLQRLMFYKTAIKSNQNSVISFEEPEAHTYPPYIKQIAQDIVDAKTNQFFITTHSPYVVDTLLESGRDELSIFMVDFKDGETIAKRLTDKEVEDVYANGVDLFFNNELYL